MTTYDSPYRLLSLVVIGSFLSIAGLIGGKLQWVHGSTPLLLLCLFCAVTGAGVMYWAAYALRTEVQNQRWAETTVAPVRGVVEHVLWKSAMCVLLVAMLASLVQNHNRRHWFWIVFLLLQTQTQIGSAFARPRRPSGTGSRLDWSQIKPLHSEHWGQR